jgi:Mn2+/Fe2+ NRAMP family transporter
VQQPIARNLFLARAVASARQSFPETKAFARRLGPGLITGAADDDPSGIATYSQAGAQFRFGLVWTLLVTMPLMIGIQMLSARIGWVTGEGLAANIAKVCPRWLTMSLVGLLVVANTINIAADIGAMAEAARLLVGGSQGLFIVLFGASCVLGRHVCRHAVLECDCAVHRHCHGRDLEPARHLEHPDLGPGRRGAASGRR